MELAQFPHIQLLNKTGIKIKELSEDVKVSVAAFEKSYKGFVMNKSQKTLTNLQSQSKIIAQHIYDYFVEDDEQNAKPGDTNQMIKDIKDGGTPNNPIPNNGNNLPDNSKASQGKEPTERKISKDEQALKTLHDSGKVAEIKKEDLIAANFECGFFSALSSSGTSWIGIYKLVREKNTLSYATYSLVVKQ